jgi:hypothetical protein
MLDGKKQIQRERDRYKDDLFSDDDYYSTMDRETPFSHE